MSQTEIRFAIEGMTCAACSGRIERVLNKLPGVINAQVNLSTAQASIDYLPETVSPAQLYARINKLGFQAIEAEQENSATESLQEREQNNLKQRLRFALLFTLPLILISMGPMFIPALSNAMLKLMPQGGWHLMELLLATPVLFGAGRDFYRHGWSELQQLAPGMNTLVMFGSSAAYFYSLLALLLPQLFPAGTANSYFEAAAVIVTLILLGKYLESAAKGRTSSAIRKLVELQPKTATVIRNGEAESVPIESVRTGDLILVKPGERVPVDGEVTQGSSFVDEAMISGEPLAVEKNSGDKLIGGTINQSGALHFEAEQVGENTLLAQIIHLVEEAQAGKPPIQMMADKIAAVFVPIVLLLASITFITWLLIGPEPSLNYAFVAAVSVLVIACPCAMGLATPTAIMVATGKGAELGLLFRKGPALEALAEIDTVVLDKTGTVTKGFPELVKIIALHGDENPLLQWAASAESQSEHPIAKAVVSAAQARNLSLSAATQFQAEVGFGLSAEVEGHNIEIGAERLMLKLGLDLAPLAAEAEMQAKAAATPIFIAVDGVLAGLLAVADPIKEESRSTVAALKERGLKVMLLTGDHPHTAQAVADQVGIDSVIANVLPADKAREVKRLQQTGAKVAFVGDGINDAPALAQAEVGIAIGTGTDIAIEAADVILMSGQLHGISKAIKLAQQTLKTIRHNFFWAYAYNVALIPLAAGLFFPLTGWLLNPMIAAAAMSVSSLFVVSNSLRLRRFKA
ncbi:MAG: heavy metal translocating P-type ATPase [Gammaproteobacteria bacterium]|nr:heavy metal translocating P-type ATPase [Gammaproteobacteria bacterium]